jgi:hypothetical protein
MKERYYASSAWRRLAAAIKRRDGYQCQICGDRRGDPYCVLNAHHVIPRSAGGPNEPWNLITVCDLCHAVLTPSWERPWFGDGHDENVSAMREEFNAFLALQPAARKERQAAVWARLGITAVR